jgi:hypothetical protein
MGHWFNGTILLTYFIFIYNLPTVITPSPPTPCKQLFPHWIGIYKYNHLLINQSITRWWIRPPSFQYCFSSHKILLKDSLNTKSDANIVFFFKFGKINTTVFFRMQNKLSFLWQSTTETCYRWIEQSGFRPRIKKWF